MIASIYYVLVFVCSIPLTWCYAWLAEHDEDLAPSIPAGMIGWYFWPAAWLLVARNALRVRARARVLMPHAIVR